MDQQGVSTTLSELGLPTPSGKFGSMNMDSFLQELWDKDPSLGATIGSLTASFQAPVAEGAGALAGAQAGAGGAAVSVRQLSDVNGLEQGSLAFAAQQQQNVPPPLPAAGEPAGGHRVIASTGFAVPADYSGKTVDEVWSAIHVSAPAPPSYDSLPLSSFLSHLGVRPVEELQAIQQPQQQQQQSQQQSQQQQQQPQQQYKWYSR
mmetsp:Transcript_2095/g.6209  ORF Transcript_2095/g.6209 Transcript_2095/m.6209 type:complete len:205 (-) Transcript_2095:10930-11544(-)